MLNADTSTKLECESERSPIADWSFHVTPWEKVFLKKVNTSNRIIRIACPFIKLRNTRLLLASLGKVVTPIRIQVLTRLNRRDCGAGVHDLSALQLLLDNPISKQCTIELRADNALHDKLYIFDDSEVFVTSSNMSYSGFYRNREVALASSKPDTLQATVKHFEELFKNAGVVTHERIASIRSRLHISIPLIVEPDNDIVDIIPVVEEGYLDSVPLDDEAIEAIEESTNHRLVRNLASDVVTVQPQDCDVADIEHLPENRFYEDLMRQYQNVLGNPAPSVGDLATIHVHASAYQYVRVGHPDSMRATAMEAIGQAIYESVLILFVYQDSPERTSGDEITTKAKYIYTSGHLVRQLQSFGLARVLTAPYMAKGEGGHVETSVIANTARVVSFRIIAYLFETRSWEAFLAICRKMLCLRDEFPFESYRHENYKSRLQEACQAIYGTAPRYDVTSEEGPDHDKVFHVSVCGGLKHQKLLGEGRGKSRKQAESDAALKALCAIPVTGGFLSSSQPEPLPLWVRVLCRSDGRGLIRMLCGHELSEQQCQAILIPFKHDDLSVAGLRLKLAAVGGICRRAMAVKHVIEGSRDMKEYPWREANMNKNARLVGIILGTPFGNWLKSIGRDSLFRDAAASGPVETSLNALIGAVVVTYGYEACVLSTCSCLLGSIPNLRPLKCQQALGFRQEFRQY